MNERIIRLIRRIRMYEEEYLIFIRNNFEFFLFESMFFEILCLFNIF